MRAEAVIVTHENAGFDAFAAMLAARQSLSGRGRGRRAIESRRSRFLSPARRRARRRRRDRPPRTGRDPPSDRDRRHGFGASRRARVDRARPVGREGSLRSSRRRRAPRLGRPERRGALSGRRAHDHPGRDPGRARAPSLPARGDGVRTGNPRGHRLADLRDDHAARCRRAPLVSAARRAPGSVAKYSRLDDARSARRRSRRAGRRGAPSAHGT